jgi:hypothetical protein
VKAGSGGEGRGEGAPLLHLGSHGVCHPRLLTLLRSLRTRFPSDFVINDAKRTISPRILDVEAWIFPERWLLMLGISASSSVGPQSVLVGPGGSWKPLVGKPCSGLRYRRLRFLCVKLFHWLPQLDAIPFGIGDPGELAIVVFFDFFDGHAFATELFDHAVEIGYAVIDHERCF